MLRFLLLAALFIPVGAIPSEAADRASLAPPTGARLLLRAAAQGVQIYTCSSQDSGLAWVLKAPEAVLHDSSGHQIGRHFAGPSWQGSDGSTVVGEVVARADAPRSDAIPWLLLRAKSHSGTGRFAAVAFIQRVETAGGLPPAAGCEAGAQGQETRVSYSAAYLFYAAR